ncbi:16S rRNA (cytidine(1402)-2'-O)-methyltransferase [Paenibacillus doosanensis]|uniref:Ribosomal RNA small subunit methyltransferase I n=1 Tax=Paenibacillus konkukensis TaxID=2020716 RepID=A0ABY4RQW1_9BACL|nr:MULTISPECIES: 16S rRNA (cytidine(1402)-2'-O)-methyltransferase [Paenibacillus]MCS7463221.1 16S rRNA (cytidine(1402)-2'-O)-methyltransferase [Paenibacillus doosanensis]UQZ84891.1 Ribosomal RNA small subunit methyltransferase I [Paenibacillus konkukensis]
MNIQKSYREDSGQGKLYLVGTPIGNLEDMTYRAVRVLGEVQLIAAEDTRQTRKLLTHFDIATRLVSYHEHNKHASGPELVRLMLAGDSIALVSDAGLPAICDPGADLVRLAIDAGIDVIPVPGANAALSALIVSGLPTERFTFLGFLPREKKPLLQELELLKPAKETLLFYESPHRIVKTLEAMLEVWSPERQMCLMRELTKKYEEAARGTIRECYELLLEQPPQGEYCIVVQGGTASESEPSAAWWEAFGLEEHVEHYVTQGLNRKEAIKRAAADRQLPKRELYNALHRQEQ